MVVQYTVQKYIHYIYNYSSNSTLVELSQIGICVIVGIISFKTVKTENTCVIHSLHD